ncbi:MAG: iron ABC transporter permease [Chloroflexota bacterium]|nr:iron ABC transporter permease [Chloroflexota bacterium]
MRSRRYIAVMAALLGLLAVVALLSLGTGAVSISPGRVVDALLWPSRLGAGSSDVTIVWELRMARVLLAALAGAGLAASGAGFQGLFRNPLADPYVVGASGGAALGAALAIILGLQLRGFGFSPVPLAAFVGSLLAVGVVYVIGEVGGSTPAVALLLAGVALSTFLGAVVALLMLLNDQSLYVIFGWLLGGFSGRSWPHLWASAPYIVVGMGILWLMARPLDAMSFGEETARSLGLPLSRARAAVVAAASLTTGAAVAAGGLIGFVGLIAPHAARLLFGAGHARLIPASALIGALLLLLADDLARTVVAPLEIPVGIVTAMLGGPFFLYLLKTRQRALGARR